MSIKNTGALLLAAAASVMLLAGAALAQGDGSSTPPAPPGSPGLPPEPQGNPATPPQTERASQAVEQETPKPPAQAWSFAGPFGTYDQAQLQRGFQVYHEVCSNCHSLKLIAFRNLSDPGGPTFSEAQVKALAATYQITDGPNDAGEMFQRPGRPSDTFPWKFPNAQAARAALGGALPPDMSVLAKARGYERGFPWFIFDIFTQFSTEGPDYIVALMQGYGEPPKDVTLAPAQYYNIYFPGHKIGMPPPLSDGQVDYTDGSPKTVKQYATDVAAFLEWAAEPKLEERKQLGLRVMLFLIVLAVLLYFTKNRIWAKAHEETPD